MKKLTGSAHMKQHGKTQISFYVPADILRVIDAKAQADGRTRTSWVTWIVTLAARAK